METWLTSYGRLQIIGRNIRLMVSQDLLRFYKSFVDKEFRIFSNSPAHGAHVTIVNQKIHKNWNAASVNEVRKEFNNRPIKFFYNPNIVVGIGKDKSFANFWMHVKSAELDRIIQILDVKQDFHLTISNTKGGVKPYIWSKPKNQN